MKKFAVIVAGGSGSRMNSAVPKQFLELKGRPVLCYTVEAFLRAYDDLQLVIVLPGDHLQTGKQIIKTHFGDTGIQFVTGGQTRFHSVQNGLKLVEENSMVFVHDAVRCMLSAQLIRNCFDAALEHGAAIPVITSKDSVRVITGDANEVIDRSRVQLVQTPQVFFSNLLLPAFNTAYSDKFTDEATVVESAGHKIFLIEGEETNIKITRPVDLLVAEKLLDEGNR